MSIQFILWILRDRGSAGSRQSCREWGHRNVPQDGCWNPQAVAAHWAFGKNFTAVQYSNTRSRRLVSPSSVGGITGRAFWWKGGPARWREFSDAVAGFLRADGKLAPIYAQDPQFANLGWSRQCSTYFCRCVTGWQPRLFSFFLWFRFTSSLIGLQRNWAGNHYPHGEGVKGHSCQPWNLTSIRIKITK